MELLKTEEERNSYISTIITELFKVELKSLIRTEELGKELNFSEGTKSFERIFKLLKKLEETNLDDIPLLSLDKIKASLDQVSQTFTKIMQFSIKGLQNPVQQRDSILKELVALDENLFAAVSTTIALSAREDKDFEQLKKEVQVKVDEISKIEEGANNRFSEIKSILEKVKKAAGEVGVTQHSIHFKDEAQKYHDNAKTWIWVTGVIAFVTLGFAVFVACLYIFSDVLSSLTTPQAVQIALAKLIVFSVLYFGLLWSGKMYKAQLHNYVVNKHRQNALNTFEAFTKAAEGDDATKNAVLIQATRSIFSPQHTGFSSQEPEPSSSPTILEIIRSAITSTK